MNPVLNFDRDDLALLFNNLSVLWTVLWFFLAQDGVVRVAADTLRHCHGVNILSCSLGGIFIYICLEVLGGPFFVNQICLIFPCQGGGEGFKDVQLLCIV